jgi:hypothetical protein
MTRHPIELFMPPNILKAKVGGFGGLDMGAIRRAEKAVQALKSEFRGWAAEDIKRMVEAHRGFARSASAAAQAALLRAANDVGCQAACFDFPLVARIATSLSRLLDGLAARDLPAGLVDAHVNAAQVIFRDNIADEGSEIARMLSAELDARVTQALRMAA